MFALAGLFLYCFVCAVVTAVIAQSRGRSIIGWFALGYFIGLFAIILVIALPSLKPAPVQP